MTVLAGQNHMDDSRWRLRLSRHEGVSLCVAGNNVGDNVLLTPAFKGTVPVGLLIAADMMVSSLVRVPVDMPKIPVPCPTHLPAIGVSCCVCSQHLTL